MVIFLYVFDNDGNKYRIEIINGFLFYIYFFTKWSFL